MPSPAFHTNAVIHGPFLLTPTACPRSLMDIASLRSEPVPSCPKSRNEPLLPLGVLGVQMDACRPPPGTELLPATCPALLMSSANIPKAAPPWSPILTMVPTDALGVFGVQSIVRRPVVAVPVPTTCPSALILPPPLAPLTPGKLPRSTDVPAEVLGTLGVHRFACGSTPPLEPVTCPDALMPCARIRLSSATIDPLLALGAVGFHINAVLFPESLLQPTT